MNRKQVVPRDQEAKFFPHELFFSTTDEKGVITFGNDVFARVSGYSMEELVGSPHNIIRHPDMPRCVFQLFWEYLHAGKAVAAYVKNMAADGSYYWVVALATPIDEGYLSIRLKPSGTLWKPVQELYGKLRELEGRLEAEGMDRKSAMAQSRAQLESALTTLGFRDYDHLMQEILLSEVSARKSAMRDRSGDGNEALTGLRKGCSLIQAEIARLFSQLDAYLHLDEALRGQVAYVQRLGATLQLLSLNAQVRSAALAEDGRTLQVVAEQMSGSAGGISRASGDVCSCMSQVTRILRSAAANIATSDLSVEMMSLFLEELTRDGEAKGLAGARHRIDQLAQVLAVNLAATCDYAAKATEHTSQLEQRLEDFIKGIRTLEILHITGRVESVRCGQGSDVSMIFHDVYTRTREAREKLTGVVDLILRARIQTPDQGIINENLKMLRAA